MERNTVHAGNLERWTFYNLPVPGRILLAAGSLRIAFFDRGGAGGGTTRTQDSALSAAPAPSQSSVLGASVRRRFLPIAFVSENRAALIAGKT